MIKQLRIQNNMTQQELADKLGIDQSAIARWESGENFPKPVYLMQLAELFNVSISAFYHGLGYKGD